MENEGRPAPGGESGKKKRRLLFEKKAAKQARRGRSKNEAKERWTRGGTREQLLN